MNDDQVRLLEQRIRGLAASSGGDDWDDVLRRAAEAPQASLAGRRSWSRRRLLAAAALAAAIAVAGSLVPLQLTDHGRVDLLDRALAVVSGGPVLHAVLRVEAAAAVNGPYGRPHFSVLDLATGRERSVMATTELWYDPARHLLHERQTVDGAVVYDSLQSPQQSRDNRSRKVHAGGTPRIDPALGAFFTGYRQALRSGSATDAGRGSIDGRAVRWLRFPLRGGSAQEIALDTGTYGPLYLRTVCPACTATPPTYRIVTLEGIGRAAANFTPPTPPAPPPGRYANVERRPVSPGEARRILGTDALWLGRTLDGVSLSLILFENSSRRSAKKLTKANAVGRSYGLRFLYGMRVQRNGGWRTIPGRPWIGLSETTSWRYGPGKFNFGDAGRPLTLAQGPVPSGGEVALSSIDPRHWTVQLLRGRLYVEIDTPTRALAIAAAKALTPVPQR